jgi:hypothetical protein
LLSHEEKMLEARVRLTSHNIAEIANPSQIHSHSQKEAAKGQQVLAKARMPSRTIQFRRCRQDRLCRAIL